MASPAATLHRLLGALEDLGRAEDVALALGDGVSFLGLQHRAAPLVTRIVEMVPRLTVDDSLRTRGLALVQSQQERRLRAQSLMDHLRDELFRVDQASRRLRGLGPAYRTRKPSSTAPRETFAARG